MMLVNAFCPVRLIEIFEDDQVLRERKKLRPVNESTMEVHCICYALSP